MLENFNPTKKLQPIIQFKVAIRIIIVCLIIVTMILSLIFVVGFSFEILFKIHKKKFIYPTSSRCHLENIDGNFSSSFFEQSQDGLSELYFCPFFVVQPHHHYHNKGEKVFVDRPHSNILIVHDEAHNISSPLFMIIR